MRRLLVSREYSRALSRHVLAYSYSRTPVLGWARWGLATSVGIARRVPRYHHLSPNYLPGFSYAPASPNTPATRHAPTPSTSSIRLSALEIHAVACAAFNGGLGKVGDEGRLRGKNTRTRTYPTQPTSGPVGLPVFRRRKSRRTARRASRSTIAFGR